MSNPHHEDHPAVISRTARIGWLLFLVYLAFYAGFLLLNIFAPSAMRDAIIPLPRDIYLDLHGINLALVYGFALIIAAMFLAVVYMRWTRIPR